MTKEAIKKVEAIKFLKSLVRDIEQDLVDKDEEIEILNFIVDVLEK